MEPVAQGAPTPVAGWCLHVGAYRFFIGAGEVAACHQALPVCQVHHAPSWLTGVALVEARPAGVIDLGRFLGLARMTPGPILVPAPRLHSAWLVQAHHIEPAQGLVSEASEAQDFAADDGNPLASRRPPAFRVGQAQWRGADGLLVSGDVLSLSALLGHPRLRELQS